ncbi:MAG: transcriptional repressor [Bacilli bacterium]
MKYSKQRTEILKVVSNNCNHPNVESIYKEVKEIIPNISLGTVYRNLNTLNENGLIKKISNPHGGDHYDKTLKDHAHIYCINCHNMFDINLNTVDNIKQIIEKQNKCEIISSNIIFTGICNNCKK